jgi:DNA invertase Pin-like site-specific DNA recombinase
VTHFAVYVRRSYRQGGDADVSDEAQVAAAVAMLPAGSTHDVIADSGGHQSGRTDARDGFRELLAAIEGRRCDGVAVYDLSRLARNARLTLNLHHAMERAGIPLLIANMPNTRWDTAVGRFMLGQLALAAQFQADMDSERAKGIRQSLFEDGRHRGLPPYGYRNGRDETNRRTLEVDEVRAAVVRRIFAELEHRSTWEIAATLQAEGAPPPSAGGWDREAVRTIHQRAKIYLGLVVRGRGLEERPGRHEPIIDQELYAAAARGTALREHRAGRPAVSRPYLLAGVLVHDCGRRMHGHPNKERRYYICRPCHSPLVPAGPLEATVLERIRAYRVPAAVIAQAREDLLRSLSGDDQDDDVTARHRARLESRLANLRKQHGWGDIDDAEYRREKLETERMLAELPPPVGKIIAFDRARAEIPAIAEALADMTDEERKATIALFVREVDTAGEIDWTPAVRPFFALADGQSLHRSLHADRWKERARRG